MGERTTKIVSISLPVALIGPAKAHAERQARSLSAHIRFLLETDMGMHLVTHARRRSAVGRDQQPELAGLVPAHEE